MHRSKIFYLSLAIFLLAHICLYAQASLFAGGNGTENDPFQVATATHLNNVRNYLGSMYSITHFEQTADIDLGVAPWNQGEGWQPIGHNSSDEFSYSFMGEYNGAGFSITGLFINRPNSDYQGLFGYVTYGKIKKITLNNASVTGGDYSGSLVGYLNNSTVNNCKSTAGIVSGGDYTGALVGYQDYGMIQESNSSGSVSGNNFVGGMAGFNNYGVLLESASESAVNGTNHVGGMIGMNYGWVRQSHATGTVNGTEYVGGLAGQNFGVLRNSYSKGTVSGNEKAGGLAGANELTIVNCYSGANVSGDSDIGGLAGFNQSTIAYSYSYGIITGMSDTGGLVGACDPSATAENSYWDMSKSGQLESAGGEGRLTTQMVFPHNHDTFVLWDWTIWKPDLNSTVNRGYPYFRPENETATQAPESAIYRSPLNGAASILETTPLQWDIGFSPTNSDIPTGFELRLGTDNPPTNIFSGEDLGFTSSYLPLGGWATNTTYYWQIVPYNAVGSAAPSDCPIWSFTTHNPNFAIIYPNGGESWQAGTTRTIRWSSNTSAEPYALSASFDCGISWQLIAIVDGSQGYYHYQVPLVNSSSCSVKLARIANENAFDTSNNCFSIINSSTLPKVILNAPSQEGAQYRVGEYSMIYWTKQNINTVALDFSTDDGLSWNMLAGGLYVDSYAWQIPNIPASQCRVRVRSEQNAEVCDISDYSFGIVKIEVLNPAAGDIFTSDYSQSFYHPITWNAPGAKYLRLEYSPTGEEPWETIINSIDASLGYYYWYLPGIASENYKVRAVSLGANEISAVSGTFTLRNPIGIVNANGGGFITNNTLFNLRWKMQDIDAASQIFWEHSVDNITWTRINSSPIAVNTEAMGWFVNIGLQDSVWLRAVHATSGNIITKSVKYFHSTDKVLQIFEPNGGEVYGALSSQTLHWDSNQFSYLDILFSADGGANWITLYNSIPSAMLYFVWTVPDIPSHNCRIRLQDRNYGYMHIESDLPFSITPYQAIAPTVEFAADIVSGEIPLSVQFYSEIHAGVGEISEILWTFGDGNTSNLANPLHIYNAAGAYTVSLKVKNDYGFENTETKTDFITALASSPQIELIGSTTLDFGAVNVNSASSAWISLKNSGTIDLVINNATFDLAGSPFSLVNAVFPITLQPNEISQLEIKFAPLAPGWVNELLSINSNSTTNPTIEIRLFGEGISSSALMSLNLQANVAGNDVVISWDATTFDVNGVSQDPDAYIVLYGERPYQDAQSYYFLAYVAADPAITSYSHVHQGIANHFAQGFYRIIAVKDIRSETVSYLRSLSTVREMKRWREIRSKL